MGSCAFNATGRAIPAPKLQRAKITKKLNLSEEKYDLIPSALLNHETFTSDFNLDLLDLSDNHIRNCTQTEIERLLTFHSSLKKLKLNSNGMQTFAWDENANANESKIDDESKTENDYVCNLELLELNNNRLHSISIQYLLIHMQRLKTLSIMNNCLLEIECHSSLYFKRLINLDLSNNELKLLPFNFCSIFANLKMCNLENNQLQELPKDVLNDGSESGNESGIGCWSAMKQLQILNLKNNELRFIPETLFVDIESLIRIDLEGNPVFISQKYIHLKGFEVFANRNQKNFDKGDFFGADRSNHTV